ncbi:hypothetical protein DQ238_18890 [Geodermatophilus sp. TF02-6]|nr:hypothetical protein DQ238_18890 [Geodermatophilus sp. TF02-6]
MTESEELLAQADQLLRHGSSDAGGWWPRTAAFLIRAALELELRAFWDRAEPGTEGAPMRAQLLVLATRTPPGAGTARDVAAAWHALSRACHHHPYELAPTAAELRAWHADVAGLSSALRVRNTAEYVYGTAGS